MIRSPGVKFFLALTLSCLTGCGAGEKVDEAFLARSCKDGKATEACIAESGKYVSATAGANVVAWANSSGTIRVTAPIPDGYYAGRLVEFTEPTLLAPNIVSGVTVFGVVGTASGTSFSACISAGTQGANCTAAPGTYWTNVAGANVSGGNGSLTASIPAGYYDGSQTATAADTNLSASNIRSGASIFGISGTLTPASPGCSVAGSQAASCTAASGSYWTSTAGANVSGANGSLTFAIPAGYYAGSETAAASDTNLTATNIRSGVSIFGTPGSLTPAYADCTDNALNSARCSTQANRYTSATLGSAVTISSATSATIPAGFYNGATSCSVSDSALVPANIKSGFSILGVNGTYVAGAGLNSLLASTMNKNKGAAAISINQEVTTYAGKTHQTTPAIPTDYRMIPQIDIDNEGVAGSTVIGVDRSSWPANATCGTGTTIDAKIADCYTVLGPSTTWNGATAGNQGFGTWVLVSRLGDMVGAAGVKQGKEVWRDERTKLLWSSSVVRGANWCVAAGVHKIDSSREGYQTDPQGYCHGTSNLCIVNSVPCQYSSGNAASACYEGSGFAAPVAGAFGVTASLLNIDGKGGLSLSSSPSVAWRLPTLADYKMADLNGIRFVLPDMTDTGAAKYDWTATIPSTNLSSSFTYTGSNGTVAQNPRNNGAYTRCVGR